MSLTLSGEAASVPEEISRNGQRTTSATLQCYELMDIYNLDELALFYRMMPLGTVGKPGEKGTKKIKDRITVALIVNADGSQKRKPIIIGKQIY